MGIPRAEAASEAVLDPSLLREDGDRMLTYGSCGLGRHALYLGNGMHSCRSYIPYSAIERVYKRIVMKGGRSASESTAYLVVELISGGERKCAFRHEEALDHLLATLKSLHPELKYFSPHAEKAHVEDMEAVGKSGLPSAASALVERLEADRALLEGQGDLCTELSTAARRLCNARLARPHTKSLAFILAFAGLAAASYGVEQLALGRGMSSIYCIVFALASLLAFLALMLLPAGRGSLAAARKAYSSALSAMQAWLDGQDGFPLEAAFCHPIVLSRTVRIIREERAEDFTSAFALMREELARRDNTCTVSQRDWEEIAEIKPLFLVRGWK